MIKCGGTVLLIGSSAQKGTSLSTVESEYKALGMGARELMYTHNALRDLRICGIVVQTPRLFCDNLPCTRIGGSGPFAKATRHLPREFHFLHSEVLKKTFSLLHVAGDKMQADGLTKALGRLKFQQFRDYILGGRIQK